MRYRNLDASRVIKTIATLHKRVNERFPSSSLSSVCLELHNIAKESEERVEYIKKPYFLLRISVAFVIITSIILIGLAIFSLITIEIKIKRHKALKALHELRVISHVIDMHQLTKDPSRLSKRAILTPSSPKTSLNSFELIRYLNYCSEMLSLTGKIGTLYAQNFRDSVVIASVNEVESLTTELSQKIWQKIIILNKLE